MSLENTAPDIKNLARTTRDLHKQIKTRHKAKRKAKTKEELTFRLISRLINEPRIKRLTDWISELLLVRTKRLFVEREIIKARKINPHIDLKKVQHEAEKQCKKWTKNNIRANFPSHLVVADVMAKHEILGWKEGDMYSSWHIAFNNCGGEYKKEFPLDKDGLPVEPPGAKRSDIIKRVFKNADHKIRKGRLGIVCDRDRERQRDSRSEWRYFLLRYDKGDGKLDDDGNSRGYQRQEDLMNRRHKGEKHQKALLREAMSVSIKKSANMVDSVLDAWTKEN